MAAFFVSVIATITGQGHKGAVSRRLNRFQR